MLQAFTCWNNDCSYANSKLTESTGGQNLLNQGAAYSSVSFVLPIAHTASPANQSLITGVPASFSVTASCSMPMNYQWRKNGTNLSNGGRISGALSSQLTIANSQTNDSGTYSVVISNAAGSTNASAVLTVNLPAVILQPPTNQMVLEGTNVAFTVAATGTLPLSYQWRLNGTNLSDNLHISGATSSRLVISNALDMDPGYYDVVVGNMASVVTSTPPALLTVLGLPAITSAGALPSGVVGFTYSQVLQRTGLVVPLLWTVVSNDLPAGLGLDSGTGTISGTPTTAGDYLFRLRLTDAYGVFVESSFSISIHPPEYGFSATQSMFLGYVSPGTNAMACQVSYPRGTLPVPAWHRQPKRQA